MNLGPLEKMTIISFLNEDYTTPIGIFSAQVNPESYSIKYAAKYSKTQAKGTSADAPEYIKNYPEEITFDFLFDSTGVIEAPLISSQQISPELGVEPNIRLFKEFVLNFNGATHQPRYLILGWGTLLFKCRLISMNVNYKLFHTGGIPVRAVATCTFRKTVENMLRRLIENVMSPDVTHSRIVKAGDTLPKLCKEIYGDPSHYREVAAANQLGTFMNLKPGTKLVFPPLEKNSKR